MTNYRPGEVVLLRFPFTDLSTMELRPAVVVSPADFAARHGDVVVLALTSQPQAEPAMGLKQWRAAGLPKPTWVKPLIGTLSCQLVKRSLGRLTEADEVCVSQALARAISRQFRT